jgi:hypothetical protein
VKASGFYMLAALSCALPVLAGCGGNFQPSSSKTAASLPAGPGSSNGGHEPPLAGNGLSSSGTSTQPGHYAPHVHLGLYSCAACFTIAAPPATSIIPTDALEVSAIQNQADWLAATDSAGSGSASGATGTVGSPSLSGSAREFTTTFANSGDERYSVSFGEDTQSSNFFYDGWVYLASPSSDIANLELDLNQVLANGQTVIFGFQCDGYSGTWDYTENAGTPEAPVDQWVHSTAACNPRNWATDTWHHVQISFARDDAGNVTYNSVWLDGTEQALNVTAPSAFALGWSSTLLTNFQVDGLGSGGSSSVYLDELTVYRW